MKSIGIRNLPGASLLLILTVITTACSTPQTPLDRILERGELRLVTIYSPATYQIDTDSESGFEYELARLFAEQLKVRLTVVVASNKAEMIKLLKQDQADIAAGLLKRTWSGDPELVAGPDYYSVIPQVIYHNAMDKPETPDDLYPFTLHVPDGLISEGILIQIKEQYPEFSWKTHPDKNSNELIEQIHNEQIAYATVYSNQLILAQQTYPELRVAFDLADPSPLIWLTRTSADTALLDEIKRFFIMINDTEYLAELIEYFYGPVRKFDYLDQSKFIERYKSRLPEYELLFKQAADKYQFDWRLLAAMSYQESHWNERARSPTGVRGMMMLTLDTARRMQVSDRLDPAQSIMGGTGYIRQLIDTIPERIQEPDRTWFGMAAYNIGFGHLEDARIITQKRGGNPDKWQDVKSSLPLLANESWHTQTVNGQARGGEAVVFVENIRKYYNTLIQLTHEETLTPDDGAQKRIINLPLHAL